MNRGQQRAAATSAGPQLRAAAPAPTGQHAAILALQRQAGNRAVAGLVQQRNLARAPEAQLAPKSVWQRMKDKAASWSKLHELEPFAKAKAKALLEKARRVEPRVTEKIKAIGFGRRGVARGLEFRIKTESSLVRKIRDQAAEAQGLSPAEAVADVARSMYDTLRYTIILQPDASYGNLFRDIKAKLEQFNITETTDRHGKVREPKNYWETSTTYKGVNMNFQAQDPAERDTPLPFEVQLHTDKSFETKQQNHEEYEKARKFGATEEDKRALNETMENSWNAVPVPEGFNSKRPKRG